MKFPIAVISAVVFAAAFALLWSVRRQPELSFLGTLGIVLASVLAGGIAMSISALIFYRIRPQGNAEDPKSDIREDFRDH